MPAQKPAKLSSKLEVHRLQSWLANLKCRAAIPRCRLASAIQIYLLIKPVLLSSNKAVHHSKALGVAELKVEWVLTTTTKSKRSGLEMRKVERPPSTPEPESLEVGEQDT